MNNKSVSGFFTFILDFYSNTKRTNDIHSSSFDSSLTGIFFYIDILAVLTLKIMIVKLFKVVKLSVLAALRLCLFPVTLR